ncbi:MAG: tetratricopeptide repeat protein [Bacteroidetes bacterium]|nr:tetratricopeptide repeat protein [Bacteroidota bacterium]
MVNSKWSILLVVSCSLLVVHCFAQDRPGNKPPLLPFQVNPIQQTTDEQMAMQFFQNRDFDKAVDIYERLYEKQHGAYYYYYFYCLVETRTFDKAEKLVKSAKKENGDAPRYTVDLGYIYFRQGNQEKAVKLYDGALKDLTANQQQIQELANAFLSRMENEYAIKTYLRGRQLLKNTYPFSMELAPIYERMGNNKEMMDEYLNLIEFNQGYLGFVEDHLQSSLANDPDDLKNEIFRKTILSKAQKEPDKSWYAELLWWYSVQQKDFELALIQAKSLDRRLKENGNRVFQLAQLCVSNKRYDAAIDAYKYLIGKGKEFTFYDESGYELLNTRYLKTVNDPVPVQKDLLSLEDEFIMEIRDRGINTKTLPMLRNLAHLEAFYLQKTDEAIDQLNKVVDIPDIQPQSRAECKLDLADILLFTNDVWEATLLYQQVYQDYKNDAIGQEAKFRNARLSYYIGEFKWAQAQLDVLKAATAKLIANDAMDLSLLISENFDPDSSTIALGLYARAGLLDYRNKEDLALQTLDSITAIFKEHPILDQVLFKEANIKIKQGKFQDADTLFGTLVRNFPEDILTDDALYSRGMLNENQLKDTQKAMACYQDLLVKYPGSIFVIDARKRFRTLRGDKIQ